jgi:hypothetical protein
MELAQQAALGDEERYRSPAGSGAERAGPTPGRSDLSDGQVVTVFARWLLIAAGFVIALWGPSERDLGPLKIALMILFGLAIGNFALHARVMMKHPLSSSLLYAFSAADIVAVTAITWLYRGGIDNPLFVFYYPGLLALSLIFPTRVTGFFTAALVVAYAIVALPMRPTAEDQQIFVARVISLAAVAAVGTLYQHIEAGRRRAEGPANAILPPPLSAGREQMGYRGSPTA